MILYFSVHEQTVSPLGSTSVPRVGSSGYLQLSFEFDESWDKFPAYNGSRTIFFQKDKKFVPVVLDESGIVDVPPYFTATAEGFMIMLVGISGSVTCPTNAISISLEPGGEAWRAEPADLNIPAYQQLVMLAQQAVAAAEEAKIPIVRGQSEDGAAYVAAGENLPGVKPGSNGAHAGKGKQIIFIPEHSSNTIESPTLQINGGDAIPIRMRAPKNQGADDSSSDATLPVPVGALMVGVPYTMTFCGMYWLVDSQIAQYACAEDLSQAELLRDSARQLVSLSETDTIGMPIINSRDGVGTAKATIVRSETENDNPDVSGNVTLPTEARVKEMAEAYVVNMTKNSDGTYTADKTFAELKAVHAAGRTVICSFNDHTQQWNGPVRLPLVYLTDTAMGFAAVVEPEQDYMAYVWAYINRSGMGHTATEIAEKDTVEVLQNQIGDLEDLAKQYVVNMTKNSDGTYTADKTFSELKAAHAAGRTVICSFNDHTQQWNGPVRLPLVYLTDTAMGFAAVVEPEQDYMAYVWACINSSGMGHASTEIVTNDGSLVHYTAENKTDAQKTQARANIGAEAAPVELTWNQETHPDVLDFLRTIKSPGRYTFADDYGKYLYTLIPAYGDGVWTYYGILIRFSGDENYIETKVYTGIAVGVLSPNDYYTPITRGDLNYRVPETTAADAGKVLTVGAGGKPVWTAVVNAEEVAV